MSTRSELYEHFGPYLLEAITLIIKDEINILRTEAGLPERTNQQLVDAIKNRLDIGEEFQYEQDRRDAMELAEQKALEYEQQAQQDQEE